ncbi:MAG: hypothetical protein Q8K82_15545 [Gemmatimonadaceae bacterium]|nr:hypothetical protein [Gemmatimonadaceae bacterium]
MLHPPRRFNTPLLQAVWSTGVMAFVGLLYRFIGGAFDPEMRSWAVVAAAPLVGLLVYLQRTRRDSMVAALLLALGLGGLLFWTVVLATGAVPITGQGDFFFIALIFAFPLGCTWLGWRQWRKVRSATPPQVPQ